MIKKLDGQQALLSIALVMMLMGCQNTTPAPEPTLPASPAENDVDSIQETEDEQAELHPPYSIGGQIAFDGGDGIYLLNVEDVLESGSDQRELWIPDAFAASWSPDGSQVAYASAPDSGGMAVYVMDIGTGESQRITDEGFWPTWSPDGTRIAFLAGSRGNEDIYVINADGSNLQQVTFFPGMENQPVWSPVGNQIAFSLEQQGDTDIFLIDLDSGEDPVNLTNRHGVDASPDWSPDGTRIAFYSTRDGGREKIFIMDADGSNVVQVTDSVYDDWHPAWSPDGRMIAFTSYRSYATGDADLYVIDLTVGMESEGNTPRQLTFSPIHDENAVWNPVGASEAAITGQVLPNKVCSCHRINAKV